MELGLVGLGKMGGNMGTSLRNAGHTVVGYDHTFMARSVDMATVRQPLHAMGRRAVEVLVQRIEALRHGEPSSGPLNIVFPTEIVPGVTLASRPRRSRLII